MHFCQHKTSNKKVQAGEKGIIIPLTTFTCAAGEAIPWEAFITSAGEASIKVRAHTVVDRAPSIHTLVYIWSFTQC